MQNSHRALFDTMRKLLLKRSPEQYSRRWPRVQIAEPASVLLPGGEAKPVIVLQLSLGGARIQTSAQFPAGTELELQFDHGAGGRQTVPAVVVYAFRENPGYYFACGLCFLGLKQEQGQWISNYIAAEQTRRRTSESQASTQDPAQAPEA
jgi:PilZ domain